MTVPGPVIELTRAVHERWPDYPPYGGAYPEIVPHVTIALDDEPRGLAAAVQEFLPIEAIARELHLLAFSDSAGWTTLRRLPLGKHADG